MKHYNFKGGRNDRVIVVVGSPHYAIPLSKLGCKVNTQFNLIRSMPRKQIELVFFTGGEDVSPWLYGGKECGVSYVNPVRDRIEQNIFEYCTKESIKMLGVCRGFQFLNVMCGGRMYQHLDHHGLAGRHAAFFPHIGKTLLVSSTHHQLVQLNEKAVPIAWSSPKRSDMYITPDGELIDKTNLESFPPFEMEAAVFPEMAAFGVQYHPEMMFSNEPGRQHFTDMVKDFIALPMDDFTQKYGRKTDEPKQLQVEAAGQGEGIAAGAGN